MLCWVQIEKFEKELDGELEHETSVIDKKLSYGSYMKNWRKESIRDRVFGASFWRHKLGTEFEKTIVFYGYFFETILNFKKTLKNVVKSWKI